ncbi:exodeoxyribonuclease I [Pseudomarimonas arenosa]|uniref:Exodeoxyribonuclease I n=1 Tax=Pseudomarimonas arenosa TaxID=2774145 RepID=A0AAW3ZPQ4_9GAMM|nr:exodeoxyribonuclease I [Pseudomarimonas arenosa]MBD8526301.1 exodeoxyribonuclease I [Pseudomarimonas arenosa]
MTDSFLWYDLETWGANPRNTQIAQFAGIRTDTDLNPIGDPHIVWVKPWNDLLPSPSACVVTGLDPLTVAERGVREATAVAEIHELLKAAGTCSVGWNTLRFDDEFIRFALYRNFHDPYAREWQYGNSRWDLLDVARLFHALRPDGIEWPAREDGAPSFRLEHLAAANRIAHGHAHEALSDVQATLGLARLMKRAQPKLWNYALKLRDKGFVGDMLRLDPPTPLLHISHRFPAERACAGVVLPVLRHPRNRNQLMTVELHSDPGGWMDLDVDELATRLYARSADLSDQRPRPPLKGIQINRCPALVALNHVRQSEWQRMGIDLDRCLRHAELFTPAVLATLQEKLHTLFERDRFQSDPDVDAALYDALPDRGDDRLRARVHEALPEELAQIQRLFRDSRGEPLMFRYRARNWFDTLNAAERTDWARTVLERWNHVASPGTDSPLQAFQAELAQLRASEQTNDDQQGLLNRVEAWQQQQHAYWRHCAGLPVEQDGA